MGKMIDLQSQATQANDALKEAEKVDEGAGKKEMAGLGAEDVGQEGKRLEDVEGVMKLVDEKGSLLHG